jgi:hypothetical protein
VHFVSPGFATLQQQLTRMDGRWLAAANFKLLTFSIWLRREIEELRSRNQRKRPQVSVTLAPSVREIWH